MSSSSAKAFYIPSLDGIRAVSFLLVFLSHVGLGDVVPGGLGVTIFFFLSGYLITTLLRLEQEETGRISFKLFYIRRTLRIFPPMYVVLLMAYLVVFAGLLPAQLSWSAGIAQALHLTNYYTITHGGPYGMVPGTGVYWSLAVEEHFYLLYPLAFVLLLPRLGRSKTAAVLLAVCAAVLVWRCVLVLGLGSPTDRTYLATDTRIDSILFGCVLGLVFNPAIDGPPIAPGRRLLAFVGGAALLLATLVVRSPAFRETLRYSLQGLALLPLFAVAISYPTWGPMPLLNARPVRYVGVLSYVLYLVHFVIIDTLGRQLPDAGGAVRAVLALALSVLIAMAIHRFVERPAAAMRKRLSRVVSPARKRPDGTVAGAADGAPVSGPVVDPTAVGVSS